MKFKIDESLPTEFAEFLRDGGHDATTAIEQGMGGASDARVARACSEESRILMTLDLDFADVRAHPPRDFAGFMVFRLRKQDRRALLNMLRQVVSLLPSNPIECRLWIVEEDRIRIHDGE